MRLRKLTLLSLLLVLNTALYGAELVSANSREPEVRLLLRSNGGHVAADLDWSRRLFAADGSTGKCAATCQEKRDACFGQCKAAENPKICQGACLDAYKSCK